MIVDEVRLHVLQPFTSELHADAVIHREDWGVFTDEEALRVPEDRGSLRHIFLWTANAIMSNAEWNRWVLNCDELIQQPHP